MREFSFEVGSPDDVLEGLKHAGVKPGESQSIAAATEQDLVIVARLDDAVVGYLAASSNENGDTIVWEHVVLEDFRDRGVGRRLLLEAARRTQPTSKLIIDPTGDFEIERVAGYYSRLGFPANPADRFRVAVRACEVVDTVGERAEEDTTIEAILRHKPIAVVTLAPDAPITEALSLLSDMGIGSIVVSPDGSTVAGVLSERDIVRGLAKQGASFLDGTVGACMTTDVVTAEVTDAVSDVMEIATVKRLRHLPVTDDGALVGVVSIGDLLVFRMREHDMRRHRLPYREP